MAYIGERELYFAARALNKPGVGFGGAGTSRGDGGCRGGGAYFPARIECELVFGCRSGPTIAINVTWFLFGGVECWGIRLSPPNASHVNQ